MSEDLIVKKTDNDNVTFYLVESKGYYHISKEEFGEREDFEFGDNVSREFLESALLHMVAIYNEGMVDGKNRALMFMNNG